MLVSDVHFRCKHSIIDENERSNLALTRFPYRVRRSTDGANDDVCDSDVIVIRHSLSSTLKEVCIVMREHTLINTHARTSAYTHTGVLTRTHGYTHAQPPFLFTHTQIYMHTRMHSLLHTLCRTHFHICPLTFSQTRSHFYKSSLIQTHTHTYIYTHIHTHSHAHTYTQTLTPTHTHTLTDTHTPTHTLTCTHVLSYTYTRT